MTEREEIINSLNACMDVHRSGLWSSGCAFCSYAKRSNPKCFMDLIKDAIELLREQPEQKHGHWISLGDAHYTCSCCRTPRHMNFVPNYCSECGARMDEEVKQE